MSPPSTGLRRTVLLVAAGALLLVACRTSVPEPALTSEAPVVTAAPAASSTPSSVASIPTPPPAAPTPAPYPEAWIREAETANFKLRCQELVYKRGCAERRTGSVTAELTLAPDGKVTHVQQIENTIHNEPEVVWRCLEQKLRTWKVHAPDGVVPGFRLKVSFGDKC